MNFKQESSRLIKPLYEGTPPPTTNYIQLSVFDKVTFDVNVGLIYAYHPPTPTNATVEFGLRKALSVYRACAGRLSKDADGEPIILLNDAGVRFVEASVDIKLDELLPLTPSALSFNFHPSTEGIEELAQVQITRFTCGSMVIGWTGHHFVADGHAGSNFLISWGKACLGLDIHPLPLHDRNIFKPRDPPHVEFEHRGVEYKSQLSDKFHYPLKNGNCPEGVVSYKIHFSLWFLAKLKTKASPPPPGSGGDGGDGGSNSKPFSTFQSLVAHLWRAITKARGLSLHHTTRIKLAVNGRKRMNPRIPDEYFGNLVLWAFPTTKVKDLLHGTLSYGAKLIHDAVAEVNDRYFKSFIDFASHKVKEENLVPTADINVVKCPNLEVDSWLGFPFHELDFGGGCPSFVMPSYDTSEGSMFLLSSFVGDGSIDVLIFLFEDHMAEFKKICYDLDY